MALATLKNVRFAGMATCVPRRILSNINDCPPSLRSERERLVRNIGIETRRICQEWQCLSDLAYDAANRLIDQLGWKKEDIDGLIVVTQSPDYLIPSTAIILQDRLGLEHTTIAYDVNLGCSGYPFGLHLLGSLIATGSVRKGLLVVGDKSATIKDPLFSDAGTVTALEFRENSNPWFFDLNSDGSGFKAIMLPVGGHRNPVKFFHLIPSEDEHGILHLPTDLILDGTAVLSFSTQRVPPAVEKTLAYANKKIDEIDYFLFHQANKMINETIRKKLRLPEERVPSTLKEFGNTSGASIPVTITARLREKLTEGSKQLLLGGFGIGLSWGTAIIKVEEACLPELIEA
ncbi:ketoacyl-ACP synthase III [Rhizobiales bacterium TNE-4]|nr:ketoacyl-ACP synthase III [Rhizobiales bacterium TNE-4]MBV1828594.1 ketoacyl-ACP synthase III [Rhizobiales bacterium TNE-4]